jgi:hypothetical protein
MGTVTLTTDEYADLLRLQSSMRESEGATLAAKRARPRKGKKDPKMARALRKANSMGRKKNGGLKKGWTQGRIMTTAHRLRRKM